MARSPAYHGQCSLQHSQRNGAYQGHAGLRVQHLPETEVAKLHRAFSLPSYSLVEKAPSYRRYSEQQRKQLLALVTQELYPKAEY